jgi:maltose alpha-D-glucosyltransferase / alpha-amylase
MRIKWYKNAVIYGLDVKLFQDSDNDGFGDFKGLTSRMDYLEELGVTCLWLMPFYPSPLKDYGYDVADFLAVDPRLGTMDDFLNFMEACEERNIRVIIDLVINHTSREHPWFIEAKVDRDSPYRDYYIWQDEKGDNDEMRVMFEGNKGNIWEYVPESNAYYLHTYFLEQADLNMANPAVRKEIFKIIRFWLNLKVSGFRIDAAHALTAPYPGADTLENFNEFLGEIREYVNSINPDAVLLGEADVQPSLTQEYFGNGDRINMLFNFLTNQYTFLSLAKESALPIRKALKSSKKLKFGHFLNFVRHHDELNLNQLSKKERKIVMDRFAPEANMRVFKDGGIKREVPSMLHGDMERIKLVYVTIFSLPGSPMIHYGEEIGMGDDIKRKMRFAVRIPMQWNDQIHGGFSKAPLAKLFCVPLFHGDFSYTQLNVESQKEDPDSLYYFMVQLIKWRKEFQEIGSGNWELLDLQNSDLAAISYKTDNHVLLVVLNFSSKKAQGSMPAELLEGRSSVEILADSNYPSPSKNITVNRYGYRWIRFNYPEII